MTQWTNDDGLTIWFEREQSGRDVPSASVPRTAGVKSQLVMDLEAGNFPAETSDLDNDGTNDGWNDGDPYIPAGSLITGAWVIVETAFTGGTNIDIGLSQRDGTVIDDDGIDQAILTAALAANLAVVCDGALVGSTALVTSDAFIKVIETGTYAAGKAKLVIEYIAVTT